MPKPPVYDDDPFADSRMSFGEHLEELRMRIWGALKGLLFFLLIGFVLDGVGYLIGVPWLGVGKPMMRVITSPVEQELRAFYDRRMERLMAEQKRGDPEAMRLTASKPVKMRFPPEAIQVLRGDKDLPKDAIETTVWIDPVQTYSVAQQISQVIKPPELTTLSVTEGMVVYIKVSLLCGLVLASPWVLGQAWAFVAAGLCPHEKRYVRRFMPMSLVLFLGGVALCQWVVLPKSIEALLWFNDWMGFAPDLRLNEWLGFAVMMPLVFGISFQTPLVMLCLERIGLLSVEIYYSKWRIAAFSLAVFAAIITPSPDALSMLALWIPLIGLYFLGIGLCQWAGRNDPVDDETPAADHLVEA